MKEFRTNILLAAGLLFVMQMVPAALIPLFIVSACAFWMFRVSCRSLWIVSVMMLMCLIPLHDSSDQMTREARVSEVHQSWCVLSSGRKKYLFYSDGPLLYDTVIQLDGSLTETESAKGFFRFDFSEYLRRKGIFYQYVSDEVKICGSRKTMRRSVQERIESFENPLIKAFLYRTVLGIGDDELISGSLLSGGFSLAAVLILLESLLSRFVQDGKRKILSIGFNVFLLFFYGFRMVLVSALIRRILALSRLEKAEKTGIYIIAMILLFQREILSAGFLIPALFMACSLSERKDALFLRWTAMGILQSLLYQKVSPFQTLFFPYLLKLSGILWLYGILILFFPSFGIEPLIRFLSSFSLVTDRMYLPGSVIGLGLPVFLILMIFFYRHQHAAKIWFALFYLFLLTGLFHPFAEVTFINVGQGDSILIREPLNLNNVLIDTGKPSQYKALQSMLDGKGIRHLDTFFVTHMDSDHSGNMDAVIREYHPRRLITEHEGTALSGSLVFHDLNSLAGEDENQSSIVLVFQMNGLTFLMPGDADQITEETIIHKFGNLNCDVLKLSHHGSKTGSCDLFLDTLKPRLAIVSSGAWQIYHHPSQETVQRLLKRHIPYLDTKDHGDISIFMIGPFSLLVTSDGIVDLLSSGR